MQFRKTKGSFVVKGKHEFSGLRLRTSYLTSVCIDHAKPADPAPCHQDFELVKLRWMLSPRPIRPNIKIPLDNAARQIVRLGKVLQTVIK